MKGFHIQVVPYFMPKDRELAAPKSLVADLVLNDNFLLQRPMEFDDLFHVTGSLQKIHLQPFCH